MFVVELPFKFVFSFVVMSSGDYDIKNDTLTVIMQRNNILLFIGRYEQDIILYIYCLNLDSYKKRAISYSLINKKYKKINLYLFLAKYFNLFENNIEVGLYL
jgi:hypothetical protein